MYSSSYKCYMHLKEYDLAIAMVSRMLKVLKSNYEKAFAYTLLGKIYRTQSSEYLKGKNKTLEIKKHEDSKRGQANRRQAQG